MSVLLKKPFFEGISQKELAEQLEAKKKCKDKLPTWFSTQNIFYPNKLSVEQSSSERTAAYKSNLVTGQTLLDLSGGLGIDSYYFSKKVDTIYHCEVNLELSQIAEYNFEVLSKKNVRCIPEDGLSFLKKFDLSFDWIYADPSRRNDLKKKVILLQDCLPNVPENLFFLFERTKNILIKTSPILDISEAIRELLFVKEVHVVAVDNEVKEVLYLLEKGFEGESIFKTVNLLNQDTDTFEFIPSQEKQAALVLDAPKKYLYEPNAAILKSGAFKLTGERLGLAKLHLNSHLYTSEELLKFPGRRFLIESVESFSQKNIKRFKGQKANITVRNFPITVAEIRKKNKILDGGDTYLFFTKNHDEGLIIIECRRVLSTE
ncbi:THUMP-like domain-containing protein [Flagellimonas allohymeniacidonis]|uniref:THUMP-like domain-containing protein n=1 Tax=Flagellimonas allohymeniacidonis TaxID=2517819 RepID=UPI0028BF0661|nr:class I SAM-dependent methyltransferase [Allomuricauda hymeniacidonis]